MHYDPSSLYRLTAALSEAVTPEDVSTAMLRELSEIFGIDLGSVYLPRQGGNLLLISAVGALAHAYRQLLPPDGDGSVHGVAIEARHPVYFEDRQELAARCTPQAVLYAASLQIEALVLMPFFRKNGDLLGTMGLAFAQARAFSAEERHFVEIASLTCGQALERARIYQQHERARREVERLQSVTAALVIGVSEQDVGTALADGLRLLEGDTAVVFGISADGRALRLIACSGLSEEFEKSVATISLDSNPPMADAARSLEARFIEGPDGYASRYPESAKNLGRVARTAAFACLPLHGQSGERLGCLAVGYFAPHVFTQEERVYLASLSGLGSQAFQKARALEQERHMRLAGEAAARTKDEFLATISHELRTPLNAILGWSALLRDRPTDDLELVDRALAIIDRNARAQAQIIDDMLDVSRIITGQLKVQVEPVDLETLVFEAIETLRHAATAKGIQLEAQLRGGPYTMVGDPARLRQIAWNLLSNAVRYTDPDGLVVIALERTEASLVLAVSDTGRGIEAAFLPFVWDRFRQADTSASRASGGLGLGLAIVRSLVEIHGGYTSAASAGLGLGATFTISLPHAVQGTMPASEVREKQPEPPEAAASGEPLRGVTLLIVDDDDDARELFSMMLAEAGAEVRTASSAAEASEQLAAAGVDILISDIGMPGQDGYALLGQLGAQSARYAAAIAVSGYARAEDAQRARDAGFVEHVAKPVEPHTLVNTVVRVWAGTAPGLTAPCSPA